MAYKNKNMFNKMKSKTNLDNTSCCFITHGTKIVGNIDSKGDIHIDGQFEGTLDCRGMAVIGPEAIIKGTIRGNKIEIWGNVEGGIFADELLSLKNSAVITGDIMVCNLSVEPGANFIGNCKMIEIEKSNQNEEPKEVLSESKKRVPAEQIG